MWHAPTTGHLGFKTIELGQELPGDVVMYFFGGRWGHVGMIRAPHSNGQFYTIEGDTSSAAYPGSDTTGGVTTDRDRRDVDWPNGSLHIFRPTGYATAPAPKPTPAPAPSVSLPTLQIGAKGAPVKALQAFLLSTFPSYAGPIKSSGGADGVFGSGTQRVVKEFQSRSRLTADGVVGPHTWQSLIGDGFKA
jgi:peptidoglycan hydrolase-like protein with peptidoglycan-binding domain